MEPSLADLTAEVIRQQQNAGYMPGTVALFRRVFNRLEVLASKMNVHSFNEELAAAFIADSANRRTGEFCKSRFLLHNETVFRIKALVKNGNIDWTNSMSILPERERPITEAFQVLLEAYIFHLNSEGKHGNTINSYRNVAVKFLLFCEANNISNMQELRSESIPPFFQVLSETWSTTSMRTSASALRTFLRFADASESVIRTVPSNCPRKTNILPTLTKKQNDLLWNYLKDGEVSHRDKAIITLFFVTGLRPVDVVELKLEDIGWKSSTIHIVQNKTGNPLTLPIAPAVGNALMEYVCKYRPKSPYRNVFLKATAPFTPLVDHAACYVIIKKALRESGIKIESGGFGGRLLRRNTASNLLKAGANINTIADCLGHVDPQSTDQYLPTDEEAMLQCVLEFPSVTNAGQE